MPPNNFLHQVGALSIHVLVIEYTNLKPCLSNVRNVAVLFLKQSENSLILGVRMDGPWLWVQVRQSGTVDKQTHNTHVKAKSIGSVRFRFAYMSELYIFRLPYSSATADAIRLRSNG